MTDEEQVKDFVARAQELFEKERGKTMAKKLNYGETVSAKVSTVPIIQ